MTKEECELITPLELPFSADDNIFINFNDDDDEIGEPFSLDDFFQKIIDISGISKDLKMTECNGLFGKWFGLQAMPKEAGIMNQYLKEE